MWAAHDIAAVALLVAGLVCVIAAVVMYFTWEVFPDTPTPTPVPIPPTPPTLGQLLSPTFWLSFERLVQLTPCPVPNPTPVPTFTPPDLTISTAGGAFAANTNQSVIVALGDQSPDLELWCRQVYFLTPTSTGFEEIAPPLNFDTRPFRQLGLVNNSYRAIAIEPQSVPGFAYLTCWDVDVATVLVLQNQGERWVFFDTLTQHPAPIPDTLFGTTLFVADNGDLYTTARVNALSTQIQVFRNLQFITAIEATVQSTSFGFAIAAWAGELLVSAPELTVSGVEFVGALVVFDRQPSDPSLFVSQRQVLEFPEEVPVNRARFGQSVFVNEEGTQLLVGCPGVNAVYLYTRTNPVDLWPSTPQQTLTFPALTDPGVNRQFGWQITGTPDGRLVGLAQLDVGRAGPVNKVMLARWDPGARQYVGAGTYEPQLLGSGRDFGLFLHLAQITGNASLLVSRPNAGLLQQFTSVIGT